MIAGGAGVVESRTGAERLTLILFHRCIATPVRFFFQEQEIVSPQEIGRTQAANAPADDHNVVAFRNWRLRKCVAVADLMADFEMVAVNLRSRGIFCGKERCIHRAPRGHGANHDKLQEIPSTIGHYVSPSRDEGNKAVAVWTSRASCVRVRSRYQISIVAMENKRIRVEMAFISGVIPRRRRDQISSGRVLSRPIRKKVTAISSSESVKIRRAAAISETRRFGNVMRQKV